MRREQLEDERNRILDNLEKIKMGDINAVRSNPLSILTAKRILGDLKDIERYNLGGMKEKLDNKQQQIIEMKVLIKIYNENICLFFKY